MRPVAYWFVCAVLGMGLTTGCGRKSADAHKADVGHGHEEGGKKAAEHKENDGHKHGKEEKGGGEHAEGEKAGVAFKEGRGLQLSPEIIKALGLTTIEATERPLASVVNISAQVFVTKPQVLATASMTAEDAQKLEKQAFTGAKINRIDRSALAATQTVEVIFVVERDPAPQAGDHVTIALAAEANNVLALPRSAILDGATGTFVYVLNGEFYLRTAVKLGARSADHVEITDGLYSGDIVVVSPVDQLWLAELRLTKGGGHSH